MGRDFTNMGQLSRPAIYAVRVAECEAAAAAAADTKVRAKLLQRAGQWRRLARRMETIKVSDSCHPTAPASRMSSRAS